MDKHKKIWELAKVVIALLFVGLCVCSVILAVLEHLHTQEVIVEQNAVKTVFYASQKYLDDLYLKGETKTSITCAELAKEGYLTGTFRENDRDSFEIKITPQTDKADKVEYVKHKEYIYTGE